MTHSSNLSLHRPIMTLSRQFQMSAFTSPFPTCSPYHVSKSFSGLSPRRPRSSMTPRLIACSAKMNGAQPSSSSSTVIIDKVVTLNSNIPRDKNPMVRVKLKAEDLGGRRRKISGSVKIQTDTGRVWDVLTSYNQIECFMPNILESRMYKRDGVVYLDQVGIISNRLSLKTKMLVSVDEDFDDKIVTFTRVEGRDFSEFEGKFFIKELDRGVALEYQVICCPFIIFPISVVERKIVKEVPKMLASIREEAILGKHIPIAKK